MISLFGCLEETGNQIGSFRVNGEFIGWKDHIAVSLDGTNHRNSIDYSRGNDVALLERAREHVGLHRNPRESNTWVTLVHPFYLANADMHKLRTTQHREDLDFYVSRIRRILAAGKGRKRVKIVVFETLHHYPGETSRLLEDGVVDDVVFTKYDRGRVLNNDDLKDAKDTTFYCAGAYNGRCFFHTVDDLYNAVVHANKVGVVQDAVIDSPRDGTVLKPGHINLPYTAVGSFNMVDTDYVCHMLQADAAG